MTFYLQIIVYSLFLLFCLSIVTESRVMLSPYGEVPVCPGSQLSFRCSTNLPFLEWNVTVVQSGVFHSEKLTVISISRFDMPLIVTTHSFTVTRDSADRSYPLMSTLTVENAGFSLNDTRVNCTEVGNSLAETSTSVATIHIISPDFTYPDPPLVHTPNVVEFGTDSVEVVLEWIQALEDGISHSIDIVPQANVTSFTNSSAQIQILYNVFYYVNITFSLCGQSNTTTSVILNFIKCNYPVTGDSVGVIFDDPALVDSNASFTCPNEKVLIGPNTSTCMENGYWEPDPSKIECRALANCGPPFPPTNGVLTPYTSTTEGASVILLCQNIYGNSLLGDSYTVLTCSNQGKWEPNLGNFCINVSGTENPVLSQGAVITVTVVSSIVTIVLISLFFTIGIICGCHFNKKKKDRSSDTNMGNSKCDPTPPSSVLYEDILPDILSKDLEMNQNMAYGHVSAITVVS